ncbi:MAG TPA: VOC family protein, partial [Flavobacterium sp.]|nr:VOC family protein [Flavobacterium sp.]
MAHVEVLTKDLEKSVHFFGDVVGMDITGRDENSVYLRAWGDYFHHTLKLTQSETSGLGHIGWRADSPEALEEVVAYLESKGAGL